MDNIDIKVYARYFIGLLLFGIGLMYFSTVRFILLPVLFGALLVTMLIPLNNKLLELGVSKNISAFIPVALLISMLFAAFYICTVPLLKSTQEFLVSFPSLILGIQNRLGISKIFYTLGIFDIISQGINNFMSDILSVPKIMNFMGHAMKWLYILFLTPIFAFYILRDRREIQRGINYIIPQRHKGSAYRVLKEIYIGINTYIYGYLFIALVCMGVSLMCFSVIRLDSFLFLSFFMGICSFIPFVGPFIGGIPAIIVASNHGWQLWYVVLVILVLFQCAASVLTPKTIGNSVNVHPIFGIIAMILGYGLFGVWGILMAVPVFVVLRPIVKYIFSLLISK